MRALYWGSAAQRFRPLVSLRAPDLLQPPTPRLFSSGQNALAQTGSTASVSPSATGML